MLSSYDVSQDDNFFCIIHNRIYIINKDNKTLYVFKPNNKGNEIFYDIKIAESENDKFKLVLTYSNKNLFYLHECDMNTGS